MHVLPKQTDWMATMTILNMIDQKFENIAVTTQPFKGDLKFLKGLKKKLSVNTVDKEGTSIAYSAQGPELVKLTEYFRRLWITATALARMPQSMFTGNAFVDIEKALDRYFKTTTQVEHIGIKQKQVDVITGKALQKIVLEQVLYATYR